MKKAILLASAMILSVITYAQAKLENDTLYTVSGYKVTKGTEIQIGKGSTPDGDFKFIRKNSSGFGTMMTTTNNNAYNKDMYSLKRSMAGHKGTVAKIVERGSKKMGYTYEPLIEFGGGMGRYEIEIDNAIEAFEIIVPEEYSPKPKTGLVVINQLSTADELMKLKKLYADSVLTKEEYETQKRKVLEK